MIRNNHVQLCRKLRLTELIKKRIIKFLEQRGLEISPNKSQTILFNLNAPFDFLGYTFVYLIRTKFIKSKLLHRNKLGYRLQGRFKLFVHVSRAAIKYFKIRLKIFIKQNQNISAYRLIALLNPKIRGWVNCYSFSSAGLGFFITLLILLLNRHFFHREVRNMEVLMRESTDFLLQRVVLRTP